MELQRQIIDFRDKTVVVQGTSFDNKDVTLTANVKEVHLAVEEPEEEIYSTYRLNVPPAPPRTELRLVLEPGADGKIYKMSVLSKESKVNMEPILHTASGYVNNLNVTELEDLRTRCRAPETARFSVGNYNQTKKAYFVEFTWRDESTW